MEEDFDIKDFSIKNIFSLLRQINNNYVIVTGWGLIIDGMMKDFDECSYFFETGKHNDYELVEELFKNEEFELEDGFYEFTANLIYHNEQRGEYGRIETPSYYDIDNIEIVKKASVEECNQLDEPIDYENLPF